MLLRALQYCPIACCYVMSGTVLAYGAMRSAVLSERMLLPGLHTTAAGADSHRQGIALRTCYVLSGTDLRICYVLSGTDVAYRPRDVLCYAATYGSAMSGTDLGYAATRLATAGSHSLRKLLYCPALGPRP
eukprot:1093154-Rhodomonas_salina.2